MSRATMPVTGGTPTLAACRVCGSPRHRFLCETRNTHSATERLRHHRCADCGSVFVIDAVEPAELAVAYASLDSNGYYEDIAATNGEKMRTAIRDLLALGMQSGRLIDIGTGNGMFIWPLKEAGFSDVSVHEIEGVDLSAIAGEVRAMYQDHDYTTIPSEAFDVVTLLDVAEHVRDPSYLMRTAHRVLRPGGIVYLHTPVVTPLDRAMHRLLPLPLLGRAGRMWQAGRTSIFHLQNYTRESLSGVLVQAGFQDVRIELRNELSWPLERYVLVFVVQRLRWPAWLAPMLAPLFRPLLVSERFNANKAIVSARKPSRCD